MQNENSTPADGENSIDILGVLITLAENIKALVVLPLLIGCVSYGLAWLSPQSFESSATIKAENSVTALVTASHVLDSALRNLGYLNGLDEAEAEEVRDDLKRNISTSAVKGADLVTVKVRAESPEVAQKLSQEILAVVFVESKPKAARMERLQTERDLLIQQASELSLASKKAQKLLDSPETSSNVGELLASIATISANLAKLQSSVNEIEEKIAGLSTADMVQSPTLPRKAVSPRKSLIAVLTTVASGLMVLIFVLIRENLRSSGSVQAHSARLAALKRKWYLS